MISAYLNTQITSASLKYYAVFKILIYSFDLFYFTTAISVQFSLFSFYHVFLFIITFIPLSVNINLIYARLYFYFIKLEYMKHFFLIGRPHRIHSSPTKWTALMSYRLLMLWLKPPKTEWRKLSFHQELPAESKQL